MVLALKADKAKILDKLLESETNYSKTAKTRTEWKESKKKTQPFPFSKRENPTNAHDN